MTHPPLVSLETVIEGWLVKDVVEIRDKTTAGYPLLMTIFAGVELLGALLSERAIEREWKVGEGQAFFLAYWTGPMRRDAAEGEALYRMCRHGIAHQFFAKGHVAITADAGDRHLMLDRHDNLSISTRALADAFTSSIDAHVRPILANDHPTIKRARMQERFEELVARGNTEWVDIVSSNSFRRVLGPSYVVFDSSKAVTQVGGAVIFGNLTDKLE